MSCPDHLPACFGTDTHVVRAALAESARLLHCSDCGRRLGFRSGPTMPWIVVPGQLIYWIDNTP